MTNKLLLRTSFVTLVSITLFACGKQDTPSFTILSSNVHKFLEPQVTALGRRIGVEVQMTYQQSSDIANEIQKVMDSDFDAVWHATSL